MAFRILSTVAKAFAAQLQLGRGETVAGLMPQYIEHRCRALKPRSRQPLRVSARAVVQHFGERPIASLTRRDAESLLAEVGKKKPGGGRGSGGPAAANRAYSMLFHLYEEAIRMGIAPAPNPLSGVRRFARNSCERVLSDEEIAAFLAAIDSGRHRVSKTACAGLRLLLLSGCRHQEIAALQWSEVSTTARMLVLADSKTGARVVPLGEAAWAVLEAQPRGGRWVFPGVRNSGPITDFRKSSKRMFALAGIEGATVHTLRHTWATKGADLGVPLRHVSMTLGHASLAMTEKYIHLAARHALPTADIVSRAIADLGVSNDAIATGPTNGTLEHRRRASSVDASGGDRHESRGSPQDRARRSRTKSTGS